MQDESWLDVRAILRAARRDADLSQAALARRAGMAQPTVASYESGARGISVETFQHLLGRCGWSLIAVDANDELRALVDDPRRDRGGRRYPPHLDVRRTGLPGDWWGDYYPGVWGVPPRPTWTFHLDRDQRDWRRASAARDARAVREARAAREAAAGEEFGGGSGAEN